MFTANISSHSVSVIELPDSNDVIHVNLAPSGGYFLSAVAFDLTGQRLFTANQGDSVSIIDIPTVSKICQDSGFDTSDIRILFQVNIHWNKQHALTSLEKVLVT
ncbi:MAG TPA: hypothetical protein VHJ38_01510 [Nitrososphaeraceae archaeon]|nr:hypothetical protein [Nitrososphaeraceae archaeon]